MGDIIRLKRNPDDLTSDTFDVVIVGAGIFGACAAWEASLRGYRVALLEQNDFGSGVSANSYKIVHGGIRYIQHLDVVRVRESCRERSALLRIAPHLVTPLPIAIPTYGYGMSGKPILSTGMYLYDLMTFDRNSGIPDEDRRINWTRLLGRNETLDLFPGLDSKRLTGATLFSDAQMYNPPRLVLAFLQSAAAHGASILNYAKVRQFEFDGERIDRAVVEDRLSGETFTVRAKSFLNTAGPWTDELLAGSDKTARQRAGVYSRDACFVVPRRFSHDNSVALLGQTKDPDAFMSRPARHLFVVPWREYSLVGTWHKIVPPDPDRIGIDREEVQAFIDEVHSAYPELALSLDDVRMCNWGLVPFGEEQKSEDDLSYGKRSVMIKHARHGGPGNLISLIGIRYTMGRGDARWAIDLIAELLGDNRPGPDTTRIPVYGGDVSDFAALKRSIADRLKRADDDPVVASLAHNHGSNARALVDECSPDELQTIGGSHVFAAEISHAIENEMATSLDDICFRRTDLASGGHPGGRALSECADLAARLLGWSDQEKQSQIAAVEARIPGW